MNNTYIKADGHIPEGLAYRNELRKIISDPSTPWWKRMKANFALYTYNESTTAAESIWNPNKTRKLYNNSDN